MNHINRDLIVKKFLDLAVIEGTPLHEKRVATYVRKELARSGILTEELAINVDGAESGNILCTLPSTDLRKPVTLLCAHLDTVQSTNDLKPVVEEDRIRSDGSTILGADNRAGVAALIYLLQAVHEESLPTKNVAVLFTVAEEIGMVGAQNIDTTRFGEIESVFVFDCSRRPGIFIQHCYGCLKFILSVRGKSAHAGVAPEKGINAIAITAAIIASLRQGKLEDEATLNIGTIQGGNATNVVPSSVRCDGEIRGPSMESIDYHFDAMKHTADHIAQKSGGSVSIEGSLAFAPFYIGENSKPFRQAASIIRRAGLEPQPIRYTGGSDANAFNAMGIPAINLGIGAQQPHSTDEFILIGDLVKTAELAFCAAGVE
jgi:tripeptide aminopeptidase